MKRSATDRTKPVHHRIAIFLDSLQVGGNETHAIRLLEALSNFGYQVTLIVGSKSGPLFEKVKNSNAQLVEIPITPTLRGRLSFILNLARFLHKMQFDIVQAYSDIMIFYVGLAAKIAGIPRLIFVLQNTRFVSQYRPIHNSFIGWTCRNLVNGIIVNSKATAQLMVRKYKIANERIQVIYNGGPVLPEDESDSAVQMRVDLGIPASKISVGILARLEAVKRIDILIKAAVLLSDLPIHFVIIGDGQERFRLETLVKVELQSHRFIFAGYQADPLPWLTALDIGVLCSESEGFPQAVLEYMVAGLPVVATIVGGIPELVVEGETGYLVPPDDPSALASAIRRLAENKEMCVQMGKNGQRRARQFFSMQQEIQAHAAFYNSLLGIS